MAKPTLIRKAIIAARSAEEARMEQERIRTIHLLLEHLLEREEATAKLILACLYDVGSVNLINHKIHHRSLNRFTKWIAQLSKPIFQIVALRWFKQNCPGLIAEWLHSQVKFKQPEQLKQIVSEVNAIESTSPEFLERRSQELLRLRSQVKMLTALLLGVTIALGGTVAWLAHRSQPNVWQSTSHVQTLTSEMFVQQPIESSRYQFQDSKDER